MSEKQFIKYRKKPIIVEAYQADEEIIIETLEGTIKAEKGDYIIKGVHGELYPCKPDIFHETYEKVYEKSNHQNNYCIDCKHCIGEPTILVSEDTGLWAMALAKVHGKSKKHETTKHYLTIQLEEGIVIEWVDDSFLIKGPFTCKIIDNDVIMIQNKEG